MASLWCGAARGGRRHSPDLQRLLDHWVRENTVDRFGRVREVRPGLVFEVAFDGVLRSARHRSETVEALLAHQAQEPMPPG
ncbi:MAG: hypothetical protein HQL41_17235 [Alphaproteobacteria bacterium]|nr:hypothetical protein [Alphaproteobacteria bacterium]